MTINRVDNNTEAKLVTCVKQLIGHVKEAGLKPTDALVKVAKTHDLNPQQVRRVAEAYNTSRSLANHNQKQAEDRCETFPLALADQALLEMFPSDKASTGEQVISRQLQKAAGIKEIVGKNYIAKLASAENAKTPLWQDAPKATPYARDPNMLAKEARAKHDEVKKLEKQAADKLAGAKHAFRERLDDAGNAVIKALDAGNAFERIERSVVARYGQETGVKLAGVLWEVSRAGERRQSRANQFGHVMTNFEASPYSEIDRFVKAALDVQTAGNAVKLAGTSQPQPASEVRRPVNPFEKKALVGSLLNKVIQNIHPDLSTDPAYNKALGQAYDAVGDPDTRDQISRVRVQAGLSDLIKNDPVISKYDPDEVLQHYNELAEVSPHMIDKTMMLRGSLRRALQQGHLDPFEAGQLVSTDKTFTEANKPNNDTEQLVGSAMTQRPELFKAKGLTQGDVLRNVANPFSGPIEAPAVPAPVK